MIQVLEIMNQSALVDVHFENRRALARVEGVRLNRFFAPDLAKKQGRALGCLGQKKGE